MLPPFDQTAPEALTIDDMPITVYTATKGGQVAGYAVESMTKNGFGGAISMMVGFTPDGEVVNVNVLRQAETPGLGTKMADKENVLLGSIQGKKLETMKLVDGKLAVKKDGGDVDALTAATISSRAYVDAINRAWMAYKSVATGTAPTDVSSGATSAAGDSAEEQTNGAVLIMSNLVISLIKNIIPDKVRIPAFIVVIASFVTVVEMLMKAYTPPLYEALGVFIPLIVVNCIILGRAEAFASKNTPLDSVLDGVGIGLGFTLSLTAVGAVREILGSGAIFGISLGTADYMPLIFVLAPGAFLVLGYLMVLFNKLAKK